MVKRVAIYNRFTQGVRFLARPFTFLHQRPDLRVVPEPAVFVCRHRNLRGPIFTMLHLNRQMHPWVFSKFCDQDSCFEQYYTYTFTQRHGMSDWLARPLSYLTSRFIPFLMRSIGGIPVYRNSARITSTFRKSLEALLRNESIIIYPDIDYISTSDQPGEIYSGFIALGQMYYQKTGKNLAFVPLDLRMKDRSILVGSPVSYDGTKTLKEERARVSRLLLYELEQIGKSWIG